MRGTIGRYKKPNGDGEVLIHFLAWKLPNGEVMMNVTVFPHPCDHCAGGDHTHVEINDLRPPFEILAHEQVCLSDAHKKVLDRLLIEKISVDAITLELAQYTAAFVHEHKH